MNDIDSEDVEMGNGVALNIPIFVQEIRSLVEKNVPLPKVLVSDRTQIVMPYHILLDQYEEESMAQQREDHEEWDGLILLRTKLVIQLQ